jgi:hypothetical protein
MGCGGVHLFVCCVRDDAECQNASGTRFSAFPVAGVELIRCNGGMLGDAAKHSVSLARIYYE